MWWRASVYLLDRQNGATMLSIPFGHCIDVLCFVLGEFKDISARMGHARTHTTLVETGESLPDDVLRKVYHENAARIIPGVKDRLVGKATE